MKKALIILWLSAIFFKGFAQKDLVEADICVYGGTSAGIVAAIEASRLGKSVILIEPTTRLGGLTTGGLGATDIGNKQAIGGISREFYQQVKAYYQRPSSWKWQTFDEYRKKHPGARDESEDAMWTFEPSAALKIYQEMLAQTKVILRTGERLDRKQGVKKTGNAITEIATLEGGRYKAKMFIDATYEGDLMAAAGVSYTFGRESNQQYGETLNGVQTNRINLSLTGAVSHNARFHNFIDEVDPYIIKGDPSSGLLPMIDPDGPGIEGQGDKKIQAYCFRMTLTDVPENRIPFVKPKTYNEQYYELLFRNYEAAVARIDRMYDYGDPIVPWINSPMPNRKTDINNQKGLSTNFIGQNYRYPEADYAEREKIVQAHREYQQGLMWTLAYHPRTPKAVRDEVSRWGTCKDEYEKGDDGWQAQLYIREARRMVSDYVVTQQDCEGLKVPKDPIGMAAYAMDSHMVQRYVDAYGFVQNEGNVSSRVRKPYPIGYRAIVPKQGECSNLLVPVCVSSSHIAFGSIRMEPVFMVLGQSAANAAVLAIDDEKSVQQINYEKLRAQLLDRKVVLK